MENYLISITDKNKNDAGPKAKRDIEHFLRDDYGLFTLNYELTTSLKSRLQKLFLAKIKIPNFFKRHQNLKQVVLQYPLYSTYLTDVLLSNIRKYTHAKLYFVIHDIESLRLFRDNQSYVQNEITFLNQADGLVVHNPAMIAWLKEVGCTSQLANLEIFDYDNPQSLNTNTNYEGTLCFAGNLAKADFLTKLKLKNHQLTLFGPNASDQYPDNILYQGQHTPEELPQFLTQSFGLVWDGDSLDACTGVFGEYMKYNNPHKVSLYLSSGLPVIIWKQAALAPFIEQNQVGITIDSLSELDQILDNMNAKTYAHIKENALQIAKKMRQGYYINQALAQLTL